MKYFKILLLPVVLFITTITMPSLAAYMPNLFKAQVTMPENTPQARRTAAVTALHEVLKRVATTAISNKLQGQLDKDAWQLIESYQVNRQVQATATQSSSAEESNTNSVPPAQISPLFDFNVSFSKTRLKTWLNKHKIGFWDDYRPNTLVWLVLDNDAQKLLVSDKDALTTTILNKTAAEYGLQLRFPKADIEDYQAVRPEEIWHFNQALVESASARYQPDAILTGKLYSDEHGWQADWHLLMGTEQTSWQANSTSLSTLLSQSTQTLAQTLAKHYQVSDTAHSKLTVQVDEVNSLARYQALSKYLHSQSVIREVQLAQITQDSVQFHIDSSASETQIANLLALNKHLKILEQSPNKLHYAWQN